MKKLLSKLTFGFAVVITSSLTAQSPGILTCVFTPTTPSGATFYTNDKRHALHAWIETSTGTFVKTKLSYWGGASSNTGDHAAAWLAKTTSVVDATTGATKVGYGTAMTFTWNGTNVSNVLVADGSYNIIVEDCWAHGTAGITTYKWNFTKGSTNFSVTPTATSYFTNASVIWQTSVGINEASTVNPIVTVSPNPSQGLFNVEYKNADNIKVINALGVIVYDEKVEQLLDGSKTINLTHMANGVYFVNVSNGLNSSNHKIILNK